MPTELNQAALIAAVATLFGYLVLELRAARTRAEVREDKAVERLEKLTASLGELSTALTKTGSAVADAAHEARRNGERLEALDRRLAEWDRGRR